MPSLLLNPKFQCSGPKNPQCNSAEPCIVYTTKPYLSRLIHLPRHNTRFPAFLPQAHLVSDEEKTVPPVSEWSLLYPLVSRRNCIYPLVSWRNFTYLLVSRRNFTYILVAKKLHVLLDITEKFQVALGITKKFHVPLNTTEKFHVWSVVTRLVATGRFSVPSLSHTFCHG
jgi:hypothetical protein